MNIVLVDALTLGNSDLSPIQRLGTCTLYETTPPEAVVERCRAAEVVITNKVVFNRAVLEALPELKLLCVAATGTNNIDLEAAAEKGIRVRNVANYSTDSVAELTLTLALELIHRTAYYDAYVKSGRYSSSGLFTHHAKPFFELKGKQWGIVGMGNIGQRVAGLVSAFGAYVTHYSTSGRNTQTAYPHTDLETLLATCDVVSIHAPLNENTANLLGYKELCRMKPTALLINVGRGGIVQEADLAKALRENRLAGAGIDVYSQEPLPGGNPLLAEDLSDKLLLTPHLAWASAEARERLIATLAEHISAYRHLRASTSETN